MRYMVLLAVTGALMYVAAAQAQTDPRICSTNTGTASGSHAYWCAKAAAVATVRETMAARQHVARWYSPTFCGYKTTLLRWNCQTFNGGDHWAVTVVWRATSSGWHHTVTVVKTL